MSEQVKLDTKSGIGRSFSQDFYVQTSVVQGQISASNDDPTSRGKEVSGVRDDLRRGLNGEGRMEKGGGRDGVWWVIRTSYRQKTFIKHEIFKDVKKSEIYMK